jgi:site-specific DNA recombinase
MNQTSNKTIKLIALYARVSTARQEEEKTIETQLVAVRDFAKEKDYTIVKSYVDEGWSGTILARPQLDQLRIDAKDKIWDAVLIYDPDRLARRYSYQELVIDELNEAGIEVIFVTTPTPKNGEDKLLYGVKGIFAEYERSKIIERFRIGKLRKVREGHILVSEPPYGYNYIPKEGRRHGYYEINPEEAEIVKMIYSWVGNKGVTIRGVVRKLQELGIKPRKSKRGLWSTSTLGHLLRNRSYIGEAHYGSTYAVIAQNPLNKERYRKNRKSSRKTKPEEEWIKISVPAIIDKDIFEKVDARLRQNLILSGRNNNKNQYLLSRKIRCICGNTRAGQGYYNKPNKFYRCSSNIKNFPLPRECHEGGVNVELADDLVWKRIVDLMTSPALLMEQLEQWINKQNKKESFPEGEIEVIKKKILKKKESEIRFNKAYGDGVFSLEQLKQHVVPIREEINFLEIQLLKMEESLKSIINKAVLPKPDEVEIFVQKAQEVLMGLNFDAKKAIVRNVIDKVVGTPQKLQVYGLIPLNYVTLCSLSRHRRAPKRGEVYTF